MGFLKRLFDTSDFPARWDCGIWSANHGWLHIISDLSIWSAYIAIPCVLGYFVVRRKDIPFRMVFMLFGAFILACGTTHLMEAVIFWWPAYRLAGVIKLFTAAVSWGTVLALVPVAPKALAMRSPEELEREIAARGKAETALEHANAELERRLEALRVSEERFRLLVDGTHDHAIYMLDPSGHVVSWNPCAERIKKYRADEIIGQHFSRFYSPEDIEAGKPEHDLCAAAEEGHHEDEGWRLRKDGSRFWASEVLTALRDGQGNLQGFSKITSDRTERMQAAENTRHLREEEAGRKAAEQHAAAVREQREWFRTTLASIGDAVMTADVDGRVIFLNPVAESLTGWSEGDGAYGKPLTSSFHIIHEQTRQLADNPIARVLREGKVVQVSGDVVLVAMDGMERPIEYCAAPIKNEQAETVGVVLSFRDIGDRRRAELALRDAEQRWRTLAEALPNLVWTDLPDGQCDYLSSQWATYTGTSENELLGLHWLDVVHPDDRERTLNCWQAACAGHADYDTEYRIRRHDGVYRWFKTRGVPFRDDHGKIMYWFGTCTDIEDHKQAELELQEADQRKNEFLATLAHELRNPLAPMRNGLQLLLMANGDREAVDRARTMMDRQLTQLVRLVDDLMDVSRITQGKFELRKELISLAAVINSAVETSRPLIEQRHHQLTIDLPPEPVFIDGDLTRLAQAFLNLLNNAAKYTEPCGRIWLTARQQKENGDVLVSVRDDGIGIPMDQLPFIFQMFTQAYRTTDRSDGGLGIGLALVNRLVEMHGGSVVAVSAGAGRGSEFLVRLPVATPSPVPEPVTQEIAAVRTSLRILIVDDNQDGANSLSLMLKLMGDDTRTAYDGETAVEAAIDFRPDVILLDLGLPKLSGYDVCRRIRQHPDGEKIAIIAQTGWGQEQDRKRTHEAGFDHHIVKPVDPDALMKLLASLK